MNNLDIVLCLFLAYGLFRGIKNGFFVELASLVSMLLGIYIAIKFSYVTREYLENHYASWNPKVVQVTAFAFTFIVVVIGVSLLAKIFTSMANFASLGIFNKILGGIFGVLKTILTISILLNLLQKINVREALISKESQDKSVLFRPVQEVSRNIYPSIADWFTAFKDDGFKFENAGKKER